MAPALTDITATNIRWTLRKAPPRTPSDDFVVDVILEARIYRELAQQALHASHAQHVAFERLRRTHERTCQEYRALRERVLRDAGAHA